MDRFDFPDNTIQQMLPAVTDPKYFYSTQLLVNKVLDSFW